MRFLADANFPGPSVKALRAAGHDVVWIYETDPRAEDASILAKAQQESRVILTFDKDFGELAFKVGLPAASGVILFRVMSSNPQVEAQMVMSVISTRSDWSGAFSVVKSSRIRYVPLPPHK